MTDIPAWATLAISLIGIIATAGAVYGAIKGDLKLLHERIAAIKEEQDYHRSRLDSIFQLRTQRSSFGNLNQRQ